MNELDKLRAQLAAAIYAIPYVENISSALNLADEIIAEVQRTSEAEPRQPLPGELDKLFLAQHVDCLKARIKELEAENEKLKAQVAELLPYREAIEWLEKQEGCWDITMSVYRKRFWTVNDGNGQEQGRGPTILSAIKEAMEANP